MAPDLSPLALVGYAQPLKLFSGAVGPTKLEFGPHMTNGYMYRVYRNRAAAAAYLSLNLFLHFSFSPPLLSH